MSFLAAACFGHKWNSDFYWYGEFNFFFIGLAGFHFAPGFIVFRSFKCICLSACNKVGLIPLIWSEN